MSESLVVDPPSVFALDALRKVKFVHTLPQLAPETHRVQNRRSLIRTPELLFFRVRLEVPTVRTQLSHLPQGERKKLGRIETPDSLLFTHLQPNLIGIMCLGLSLALLVKRRRERVWMRPSGNLDVFVS